MKTIYFQPLQSLIIAIILCSLLNTDLYSQIKIKTSGLSKISTGASKSDNDKSNAPATGAGLAAKLPDLIIEAENSSIVKAEATEKKFELQVKGMMQNISKTTAGQCSAGIYLSEDDQITGSDLFLDYFGEYLLGLKGIIGTRIFNLAKPEYNLKDGTYYVGIIADYENQLQELKESNNALLLGKVEYKRPAEIIAEEQQKKNKENSMKNTGKKIFFSTTKIEIDNPDPGTFKTEFSLSDFVKGASEEGGGGNIFYAVFMNDKYGMGIAKFYFNNVLKSTVRHDFPTGRAFDWDCDHLCPGFLRSVYKSTPGTYTVRIDIHPIKWEANKEIAGSDVLATGEFKLTISPGDAIKLAARLGAKKAQAGMKNAAMETQIKTAINDFCKARKYKRELLAATIISKDWEINKNQYTGVPLDRFLDVQIIYKDENGDCAIKKGDVSQEYMGGGKYSSTLKYTDASNKCTPCPCEIAK